MGKYKELAYEIKMKILNGTYEVGSRLPSIRALSIQYNCNANTMYQALNLLRREGIITSERTIGYYVINSSEKIDKIRKNEFLKCFQDVQETLKRLGYDKEKVNLLMMTEEREKL